LILFDKNNSTIKKTAFFFEDLHVEMKKRFYVSYLSIVILFILPVKIVDAQESAVYGKHAFSINLTRSSVNELNVGYEYWLNFRKSIEINWGLVYVNSFFEKRVSDWKNATLFSEHGYAGRLYYKIYKRPVENSKWRDYMAFGVSYKYLYFNDYFIDDGDIKYDSSLYKTNPVLYEDSVFSYSEQFLRDSKRHKIGVEFIWGKVYEASRTIAFEFYFGAGINANIASHTDHSRNPIYVNPEHQWIAKPIPDFKYEQFYMRPVALLGIKFRLRF